MLPPVLPVLYVPLELGEVAPAQSQQIQVVPPVSQVPLTVPRRMLRLVLLVLLPVSQDQPISPLLVQ